MDKNLDEKLLSPTQSYEKFSEWEDDFTKNYLKNNPYKTQNDLMFDPHYNSVRNKVHNKFVALKNGTEYVEEESDASKSYWAWREAEEKRLDIENNGKTPEQIINESMQATREKIKSEKFSERKESKDKIAALRAIFTACNPRPSDRFKK